MHTRDTGWDAMYHHIDVANIPLAVSSLTQVVKHAWPDMTFVSSVHIRHTSNATTRLKLYNDFIFFFSNT